MKPLIACMAVCLLVSAAAPQYEWYQGETKVYGTDDRLIGTSEAMCRRRLFPDQNLIIEQVVSFSREGKAREFVTIFNITGNTFRMVEANGAFTGTGELEGKSWDWSHWHSSSTMTGEGDLQAGSTVDSDDRKNAEGFVATKLLRAPNGTSAFRIVESYRSVSEATYMERYRQLFP
jgi:hypothetical protein